MSELRLSACNREEAPFQLVGTYRVQSETAARASSLEGRWLQRDAFHSLEADAVAQFVRRHPACICGDVEIKLLPALVSARSGTFLTHGDALYYGANFSVDPSGQFLNYDILDVTKLADLWNERLPLVKALFGNESPEFDITAPALMRMAIDEYMCHEGGHKLGLNVESKQQQGYFRLGGKFRWPLVYIEEFRADINSWALALEHLDADRGAAVVKYTILHRLGLAGENLKLGRPGAGYVPYLVFMTAWRAGFLIRNTTSNGAPLMFSPLGIEGTDLCETVHQVVSTLTQFEADHSDLLDIAAQSMSFLRASLDDTAAVHAFQSTFLSPEGVS
jgi:hypothetical protein